MATGSSSHGTGYAYLTLASNFCSADAGIVLNHIAKKSCSSKGSQYALLREFQVVEVLIENGRGNLTEHINDGYIGHVTFSRGSETAVEGYFEALGLGMALGVDTCCIVRSHRMTA